jgi:hypothetical protein
MQKSKKRRENRAVSTDTERDERKTDFDRLRASSRRQRELEEALRATEKERETLISQLAEKWGPGPWDVDGKVLQFFYIHADKVWTSRVMSGQVQEI